MSLLPTPTYSAPATPLYVSASALQFPIAGNNSNLTWSAATGAAYPAGSYYAFVPAAGGLTTLYGFNTTTSVVSAELRVANATDATASWVIWAKPVTTLGGSIQVLVAAQPTDTTTFQIAWAIQQI
jgi:hypothetical protein